MFHILNSFFGFVSFQLLIKFVFTFLPFGDQDTAQIPTAGGKL